MFPLFTRHDGGSMNTLSKRDGPLEEGVTVSSEGEVVSQNPKRPDRDLLEALVRNFLKNEGNSQRRCLLLARSVQIEKMAEQGQLLSSSVLLFSEKGDSKYIGITLGRSIPCVVPRSTEVRAIYRVDLGAFLVVTRSRSVYLALGREPSRDKK